MRTNMQLELVRTLAVLVTVALIPLICHAQPKYKIGFIGDFSGPAQVYGDACKNGFELARSEASPEIFEVIYEDDEFKPSRTVSAFRKLVEFDKVDLVISLASSPSNAVAPLAERHKVPLIAWASDVKVAKNRPYVIRSWPTGEQEGQRLAEYAREQNYSKVAFIISTNDYARSMREGFVKYFPAERLVLDKELSDKEKDFKPILLQVKKSGADAIGMCPVPGQPGVLAKQAKELQLPVQFFGCENLHDKSEVESSQGALIGSWFVTAGAEPWFRDKYVKEYGNESVISGAAIHYDIAKLLYKILPEAKDRHSVIPKMLQSGTQTGATGNYQLERTADADQYINFKLVVKEITEGGFQVIG